MKRYRVLSFHFDSRADALRSPEPSWDEETRSRHLANQRQVEEGLRAEFGAHWFERKREDFLCLGMKPFSILAFHNRFLDQVRSAFVLGAYFPALTGACALGERILNHLVILLRDDFRATAVYKRVARKKSFDDWSLAIDTLVEWDVLLPSAASSLRNLRERRNEALHFRPEVDQNARGLALDAIKELESAIQEQFSAFGPQPWFISGIAGASYIRREAEEWPFVKRIYLPNSHLVGPSNRISFEGARIVVHDPQVYPATEISDVEFAALLQAEGNG